jgi:hypothetical protein
MNDWINKHAQTIAILVVVVCAILAGISLGMAMIAILQAVGIV